MTPHRKDSRKLDSRGTVSSGCPGRQSHSCRCPGEQNPGCQRDPGLSGRPPCFSGYDYTVPPGSRPKKQPISEIRYKRGIMLILVQFNVSKSTNASIIKPLIYKTNEKPSAMFISQFTGA